MRLWAVSLNILLVHFIKEILVCRRIQNQPRIRLEFERLSFGYVVTASSWSRELPSVIQVTRTLSTYSLIVYIILSKSMLACQTAASHTNISVLQLHRQRGSHLCVQLSPLLSKYELNRARFWWNRVCKVFLNFYLRCARVWS